MQLLNSGIIPSESEEAFNDRCTRISRLLYYGDNGYNTWKNTNRFKPLLNQLSSNVAGIAAKTAFEEDLGVFAFSENLMLEKAIMAKSARAMDKERYRPFAGTLYYEELEFDYIDAFAKRYAIADINNKFGIGWMEFKTYPFAECTRLLSIAEDLIMSKTKAEKDAVDNVVNDSKYKMPRHNFRRK